MTRRRVVLAVIFVTGLAASPALAFGECVVPKPLPSTPLQPVLNLDISRASNEARMYLWRQRCEEGSDAGAQALYVRITPVSPSPVVCSFVTLIQNSRQIDATLRTGADAATFCGRLFTPTTFLVVPLRKDIHFDNTAPFTFVVQGDGNEFDLVEVPALGVPPPPPPTVTIVATGCTACRVGDLAELRLHFVNPGPAREVELKLGSRFPDGATSVLFLGRYVEHTVPEGESDLAVPSLIVPEGLPFGTYVIEASILDPDFGTTLSHHVALASLER